MKRLGLPEIKCLKMLEDENAGLKRIVADLMRISTRTGHSVRVLLDRGYGRHWTPGSAHLDTRGLLPAGKDAASLIPQLQGKTSEIGHEEPFAL
jgi:hypothetical protein